MIEIELKFQINSEDIVGIHNKLRDLGFFISKQRVHEMNMMYDNKSELMQKTNGRIRIRKSGNDIEFAYKKPLDQGHIKKEIEYEVTVSDLPNLTQIIEMMEFYPTTSYERYRAEYVKDGVKVTLDEYPFSSFVEIEGDEEDIVEVSNQLGFDISSNLKDPCDTLFRRWREDRGLAFKPHMNFDDYDK